ncbi:MAG: hypothetical protein AAFX06_21770 [Planctomycetota bacterium]
MSSFLYFIPDVPSVSRDIIEAAGLAYAIDHTTGRGCDGPKGGRGMVLRTDDDLATMDAESQSWLEAPKFGADQAPYWIGWNGAKPTPEDLARKEQMRGQWITVQDGSRWYVPTLLSWSEGKELPAVYENRLPTSIGIDDNGNPTVGQVVPKYRDMFDIGLRVVSVMAGRGEEAMAGSEVIKFAANCLGINYRVSLLELSASVLGCISTDDAFQIAKIAVDWAGYEESVGNWAGRQGRPTGDTESGSEE